MGVATGTSIQSTYFFVPQDVDVGSAEVCVFVNGIQSNCVPVEVGVCKWWLKFDEAMVNFLIGSLADRPLWVLGPNGPIPVDPWGPVVTKQAQQVRVQTIKGMRSLQRLGSSLAQQRLKASQAVPPQVDPDLQKLIKRRSSRSRKKSRTKSAAQKQTYLKRRRPR
ncbi:MAG TPA: hypothetical protein VKB81_05045 [Nitrospira sp.]|nr:hypothetical protein [Nitrospira sp.]